MNKIIKEEVKKPTFWIGAAFRLSVVFLYLFNQLSLLGAVSMIMAYEVVTITEEDREKGTIQVVLLLVVDLLLILTALIILRWLWSILWAIPLK